MADLITQAADLVAEVLVEQEPAQRITRAADLIAEFLVRWPQIQDYEAAVFIENLTIGDIVDSEGGHDVFMALSSEQESLSSGGHTNWINTHEGISFIPSVGIHAGIFQEHEGFNGAVGGHLSYVQPHEGVSSTEGYSGNGIHVNISALSFGIHGDIGTHVNINAFSTGTSQTDDISEGFLFNPVTIMSGISEYHAASYGIHINPIPVHAGTAGEYSYGLHFNPVSSIAGISSIGTPAEGAHVNYMNIHNGSAFEGYYSYGKSVLFFANSFGVSPGTDPNGNSLGGDASGNTIILKFYP